MNCLAVQTVLTCSRSANAARIVLLVIAAHADDAGRVVNLPIRKIMEESNAKERTVKYAIEELRDDLKEIATEREGKGRGSTFDFDISPLLKRVQISASDKGAESAPITSPQIKSKGAKTDIEKGANNVVMGADIAPLSDGRVQNSTGTPLASSKAETTNTNKELKTGTARKRAVLADFDLPDWLPPELVQTWLDYRAEIGHPVARASAAALVKRLGALRAQGYPPDAVIEQTVANGWRGLFELPERKGFAVLSGGNVASLPPANTPDRQRELAERYKTGVRHA